MKRLLFLILSSLIFLSGCQKNQIKIAPAALFVMDGGTTNDGVSVGDSKKAFIDAYSSYEVQVAYSNQPSGYLVMSIDEIPYEKHISTLIATLFIDGEPVSEGNYLNFRNLSAHAPTCAVTM